MKSWILENMHELFGDTTVYLYRKIPTGLVVDKLTPEESGKFGRSRYSMAAGQMCTCLGFMKTDNCKHLKMLGDSEGWPVMGVPGDIALIETRRLRTVLQGHFELPSLDIDEDTIMSMMVRVVEIVVPAQSEIVRMTSIKKTKEGSYGVAIILK